jgi:hypothetical protein
MRKRFKHAPSPAMVVAIVAVILALGGSAVAALSKKDKKQVKSIANSEISKRASGLAVASAGSATSASDASKLGGVAPSGYTQGGGHTVHGVLTGLSNSNNNVVLEIPGIGQVQFDCAANGLDTTPELRNTSGTNFSALGQTQIGATPSLDPNSTTFNNGNTLALASRQVGTTHLQVWGSGKTATITISNIFCLYTASASTNQ